MTDKQRIIAEIERLKKWEPNTIPQEKIRKLVKSTRAAVCIELLDFINSLPAEQSNEDLDIDEELQRFFETKHLFVDADDLQTVRHCNGSPTDKTYYFEDVARHFARLQKEQMMKGLCYETKVYRDEEGDGIDTPIESWLALENNEITNLPNIGLKDGDKVKILIVKEDE